MSLRRILRKYLRCWEEFLLMIGNGSLLVPFVILALVEIILLVLLITFTRSPFSYFMVPLIGVVSSGKALHYPNHLILLPSLFNKLSIPVVGTLGFILFGWGVLMMADYYAGTVRKAGSYIKLAAGRGMSFMAVGIIFVTSVRGLPYILDNIARGIDASLPRTLLFTFSSICGFIMEVLLVYSLLFLRVYGGTAFGSIEKSIRFALSRFILTSMVVLTALVIHRPFDYLLSHPNRLALKFNPENVLFIIFTSVVLGIFTNFFVFSTTTYLVLGRRKK